jgi:hypothetical protein
MQIGSNPAQTALPATPGEFLPSAPARATVLDFDLSQPPAEMKAADPIVRETGNIVVKINPSKIRTSGVPNRCESAFAARISKRFASVCKFPKAMRSLFSCERHRAWRRIARGLC